jgi:CheY-like chemotaxis protein
MAKEKLNILFVEDDHAVASSYSRLIELKVIAAYVIIANTLQAAKEFLETVSGWDIILLDLNLPDSKGTATLKWIRDHYPKIPVVVMTAHSEEDLELTCIRMGAQDCVSKFEATPALIVRSLRFAYERELMVNTLREALESLQASNAMMKAMLEDREG